MAVDALLGMQRGDEGKGRFVDYLAEHNYDAVARFNGGNNAGHTVVLPDGQDLALHLVPSGVAHEDKLNIIGNGTFVNPVKLVEEIADIRSKGLRVEPGNLKIAKQAHVILPHHILADEIREAGAGGQGSTKSGIAQVAADKALREGVRMEIIKNNLPGLRQHIAKGLAANRLACEGAGLTVDEAELTDRWLESAAQLGMFVTDTVYLLGTMLERNRDTRILAEGAQAFLLDIEHGMAPYTTSSPTTTGGVATGLGIPASYIEHVYGVVKAVQSHVGGGPFVTEITDEELLEQLHGDPTTIDAERGKTTGRVRRLGYLDLPQIRRALMVNAERGRRSIALSKLDWVPRLGEQALICTGYICKDKEYRIAPDSAYRLENAKPVYTALPTWEEDITDARRFEDLPPNAQAVVQFIEQAIDAPIEMIGVGPQRDQMIHRAR